MCFQWRRKSWGIVHGQGEGIGIIEADRVTQSYNYCIVSQLEKESRVDSELILRFGITDEGIQVAWLEIKLNVCLTFWIRIGRQIDDSGRL